MQRPLWLIWVALVVTFTPAGADAAEAFPCQQLTGFWIWSAWPEEEGGVIPRAGDTFTVTVQADPSVEPTELIPGSPRYHQDGAGAHLRLTLNDSGSGKTRDFAADVYRPVLQRHLRIFRLGCVHRGAGSLHHVHGVL